MLERTSGSAGNAGQRLPRHADGKPGLVAKRHVDIPEQRSSTCDDHALIDDVSRDFRAGMREGAADNLDDLLHHIVQRLGYLRLRQSDLAEIADGDIASAHV